MPSSRRGKSRRQEAQVLDVVQCKSHDTVTVSPARKEAMLDAANLTHLTLFLQARRGKPPHQHECTTDPTMEQQAQVHILSSMQGATHQHGAAQLVVLAHKTHGHNCLSFKHITCLPALLHRIVSQLPHQRICKA